MATKFEYWINETTKNRVVIPDQVNNKDKLINGMKLLWNFEANSMDEAMDKVETFVKEAYLKEAKPTAQMTFATAVKTPDVSQAPVAATPTVLLEDLDLEDDEDEA
jgi:hypothetical protein